jgi:small subunit ribosomal protein S20
MANHKQAEKRIRQTEVITERNRARRSRIRTYVKAVETAIEAGDKEIIGTAFTKAMSEMHRGVTKGVLKQTTASRKIARLSARIKSLTA